MLVFAAHDLVAILPFYRIPKPLFSLLRLIGSPDSDYLDLIITPGFESAVMTFFFGTILPTYRTIGMVELDAVPEASPLSDLLAEFITARFQVITTDKICPYIPLPSSYTRIRCRPTKQRS